jgi:hypothetical protein
MVSQHVAGMCRLQFLGGLSLAGDHVGCFALFGTTEAVRSAT